MKLERYAPYWKVLSGVVRFSLGKATCRHCGALHGIRHPRYGGKVSLAAAHLVDKDPLADRLDNLAPLCQWCHLEHDKPDRNGGIPRYYKPKIGKVAKRKAAKARLAAGKPAEIEPESLVVIEKRQRDRREAEEWAIRLFGEDAPTTSVQAANAILARQGPTPVLTSDLIALILREAGL